MNGNLVDTSAAIKYLNGDLILSSLLDTLGNIHVSVVTIGEMMYGAFKSAKRDNNLKLFNDFFAKNTVLGINVRTAVVYGEIKSQLVRIGVNTPDNDLWIAATAIEHGLELVTCDRHFTRVQGLRYNPLFFEL
ncbi:MAG: PIN domain-containing protein [Firmicutes bacterium]|nr:PIN domain-containing protein [Bacillota bacterium]